jgi:hypothetical protein
VVAVAVVLYHKAVKVAQEAVVVVDINLLLQELEFLVTLTTVVVAVVVLITQVLDVVVLAVKE